MKRTIKERAEIVRQMRRDGKTVSEIAAYLEMSEGGVAAIIKRNGIPLTAKTETRTCELCGKLFTVPQYKIKKYCSDACERKASHKRNTGTDETAFEMVQRLGSEWEYAGGYSGSDGFMMIRHKPCGTIVRKSSQSVRKGRNVICEHCRKIEREKEEEKRKKLREELKEFYKPVRKTECISMQVCKVCGGLFVGDGKYHRAFCSDECRKKSLQHYYSLKKEKRRRKACTEESKSITLEKLYKRDGGICWICGGRCDPTADSNANNYPSIDHVRPISRGGKDRWDNIKLAHRLCNSLRGDSFTETEDIPKVGFSM